MTSWIGRMFSEPPPPPDTISDPEYRQLQDRARRANRDLDRLDNPEGIRRRKAAARQHDRRELS